MTATHNRISRWIRRRLTVVLVGAFLVVAPLAGAADAVKITSSGSYSGTAGVPSAQLMPVEFIGAQLWSMGRRVYENPTYSGSWQWVCVTHRLLEYNHSPYPAQNKWVVYAKSPRRCGWISPAATYIHDPGQAFELNTLQHQDLSLDVVITWQLPSGYTLGKRIYSYNTATDYRNGGVDIETQGYLDGVYYFAIF